MNLEQFIQSPQYKYAVITKASYDADETAQSISQAPNRFLYQGVEMVLLSICVKQVQSLYDYVQGAVEFQLTIGTGLVTLLLHEQVQETLLDTEQADEN
jgi:hypothetical protein